MPDFDEEKHPRDEHGKFIDTGGDKLKAWGLSREKLPARDAPDERIPKVGDFMRAARDTLAKNPGGFTVRPGYSAPTSGTIVSLATKEGLSLQVPKGEKVSRAHVREWVKKAREYLRNHDDTYIGGWKDENTGTVYFDVNERYKDHDKAMALGRARNQVGVFRLDDFSFHSTGGDGK